MTAGIRGWRLCTGHCALYEQCPCPDADGRHGDGAPARAEAIRRILGHREDFPATEAEVSR